MRGSWRAEAELPTDEAAPGTARALLDQLLRAWQRPQLLVDARIVVSELVANAVQHAGDSGSLLLRVHSTGPDTIYVGLSDGSKINPVIRELSTNEETGRGMHIVEQLAARWGVDPDGDGKRVWVESADSNPRVATVLLARQARRPIVYVTAAGGCDAAAPARLTQPGHGVLAQHRR